MSKKLDPRVIRTRKLLREALVELIVERGFEALIVKDVTDRATLNHATFYLHYSNLKDLLNHTLKTMLEELASGIPPASPETAGDINAPIQISTLLFRHFATHAAFYKVILGSEGVASFSVDLRDYLADTLYQRMNSLQATEEVRVSPQFAAQFLASAYTGMIQWWLENDEVLSPEHLAQQFITLTAKGVYSAIGLHPPEN